VGSLSELGSAAKMVSLCSSDKNSFWVGSVLEAMVVNTVLAAHNSLALWLLVVYKHLIPVNVALFLQ